MMKDEPRPALPWSVTASLGYTVFQNMFQSDGQTALGRLAISKALVDYKQALFGLEVGVQSGNTMRVGATAAQLNDLSGLPVQSTIKPMLDLLATMKSPGLHNTPVFLTLKGGLAFRRWQFNDRTSIEGVSNTAGELQAGLGLPFNTTTSLSLAYQGIYGGNPNFTVDTTRGFEHVGTIPIQQGILLSLTYLV
ncbi:MAG: hypothetical protein ACOYKA_03855 [Legionellaceae bacterium]